MANLLQLTILVITLCLHCSWAQVELSECEIGNLVAVALDPSATPQPCEDSLASTTEHSAYSPTPTPSQPAPTPPPPTPSLPPPTPSSGTHSGGDQPQCNCVTYYLCSDDFGEGVIQIKNEPDPPSPGTCPHYMDVCCYNEIKELNVTSTTKTPLADPNVPKEEPWTCGNYDPKGLGLKIVGIDNEANYGEFPWMVAVLQHKEVNPGVALKVMECGGSIIHPQVVLTAAHCVKGKQDVLIRAGEWDAQTDKELYPIQERKVSEVVLHEGYYGGGLFNDVALLVLESPLESSPVVNSICLPEQGENMDNRRCFSSGWGKDGFGREDKYQTILKRVTLDTVPRKTCQEQLRKTKLGPNFTLHPTFICAGGKKGEDTCKGDGGGPLVCPSKYDPDVYIQAGIVAWGIDCGAGNPAAYVNLPLYRNWIDEKLQSLATVLKISDKSILPKSKNKL